MVKLVSDPNIEKFCKRLRESEYYPQIKKKLENDPKYLSLKANLINHKKIIERLTKKARIAKEKGRVENAAEYYQELRKEMIHKIDSYDFMIVEIDALAASKTHPKLLKNMVLKEVDKYFDNDVYEEELRIRQYNIDTFIKPRIHREIKRFLNLPKEDREREEREERREV
jgi:hypothetical protein